MGHVMTYVHAGTHASTHLQPQVCLDPSPPAVLLISCKDTWGLQTDMHLTCVYLVGLSQTPPSPGGRRKHLWSAVLGSGGPCWRPGRDRERGRRPAGGADVKPSSVAGCGLCNPTPALSIFRGLYNGPRGAGTQAHLVQQKDRLTGPPTSPGHSASKGQARTAAWASGVAGEVSINRDTHTHIHASPVIRGRVGQAPGPLGTPPPQSP